MSSAALLDGKAHAKRLRSRLAERCVELAAVGVVPGLAVVLVGDDPASAVYVAAKSKAARECGVTPFDHRLAASTTQADLLRLVATLNADPAVHGILIQMPLPKHLDTDAVLAAIDPRKDVDGLHPLSLGKLAQGKPSFVPCTPRGIMHLVTATQTQLAGAKAVVLGRSVLVGKPIALLLSNANATVTLCHSKTQHLADEVRAAQIVIAAVGQPAMVPGDWIAPGAVVIDVGINRLASGQLVGDVDFAAACQRAGFITPVPGGVGPMTIACLLENTVDAAASTVR